jgi:hypothetical protein
MYFCPLGFSMTQFAPANCQRPDTIIYEGSTITGFHKFSLSCTDNKFCVAEWAYLDGSNVQMNLNFTHENRLSRGGSTPINHRYYDVHVIETYEGSSNQFDGKADCWNLTCVIKTAEKAETVTRQAPGTLLHVVQRDYAQGSMFGFDDLFTCQ